MCKRSNCFQTGRLSDRKNQTCLILAIARILAIRQTTRAMCKRSSRDRYDDRFAKYLAAQAAFTHSDWYAYPFANRFANGCEWRLHRTTSVQTGVPTDRRYVYTGRLVCIPVCIPVLQTQPSKQCLRIWPRPLASLVKQCLRRRNRPGK